VTKRSRSVKRRAQRARRRLRKRAAKRGAAYCFECNKFGWPALEAATEQLRLLKEKGVAVERTRLQRALTLVRTRQDKALAAKLDGEISADFWQRNQVEWHEEELMLSSQIENLKDGEIDDRIIDLRRTLELSQKAYSLYVTRKPQEQAELMKSILLNCTIDGASLYPTYRKPFDIIAQRARNEQWSGRGDLNSRPLAPQASALPG
jgi:site-specific DNA recombinase